MSEKFERWRLSPSRRGVLSGSAAAAFLTLAGCGRREKTAEPPPTPEGPPKGSLEWAVEGPWRAQDRDRDRYVDEEHRPPGDVLGEVAAK